MRGAAVHSIDVFLHRATALTLVLSVAALAGAATAQARLPRGFFGIAPQTSVGVADAKRMRHGGVESIRVPVPWPTVQPAANAPFNWSVLDEHVAVAARNGMDVLPSLGSTPRWLAGRETVLPISNRRQRRAWAAFLRAAVQRYGTHGQFWREHSRSSGDFVPRRPIRKWQIWNEENFFYFTTPASPARYGRLLKISHGAIKGADRRAEILIGGLFGNPKPRPPRAMNSAAFLVRLYRIRGIKRTFDGVALHPYAADVGALRRLVERVRRVMIRNRDRRSGLYITEMGWGSQRNQRRVAFEVGWRAQARELRRAYGYLIRARRRLNLKQVYWFTWKDVQGACSFCDSSGLFRRGPRFKAKPAWHSFVALARGRRR